MGGNNQAATAEFIALLNARGINVFGSNISGVPPGTTLASLRSQLDGFTISGINNVGGVIADDGLLGTGNRITIRSGDIELTYTLVIFGDITGTGQINSSDLLALRQHLLGTRILNGSFAAAADINRDGVTNSADLLIMRQHLLGTREIVQ